MRTGTEPSIESLLDDFEAAVKEAAFSDCSPMGDPGNYYKHMERDEAHKALIAGIGAWKRALSDLRGHASVCLALNPTPQQMRHALERISGDEYVQHDHSPSPCARPEGGGDMSYPPEHLKAAAKALGGTELRKQTFWVLWGKPGIRGSVMIGSDADLAFALLDTMPGVSLNHDTEFGRFECGYTLDDDGIWKHAPTRIAAILACIHAMGGQQPQDPQPLWPSDSARWGDPS